MRYPCAAPFAGTISLALSVCLHHFTGLGEVADRQDQCDKPDDDEQSDAVAKHEPDDWQDCARLLVERACQRAVTEDDAHNRQNQRDACRWPDQLVYTPDY